MRWYYTKCVCMYVHEYIYIYKNIFSFRLETNNQGKVYGKRIFISFFYYFLLKHGFS